MIISENVIIVSLRSKNQILPVTRGRVGIGKEKIKTDQSYLGEIGKNVTYVAFNNKNLTLQDIKRSSKRERQSLCREKAIQDKTRTITRKVLICLIFS